MLAPTCHLSPARGARRYVPLVLRLSKDERATNVAIRSVQVPRSWFESLTMSGAELCLPQCA